MSRCTYARRLCLLFLEDCRIIFLSLFWVAIPKSSCQEGGPFCRRLTFGFVLCSRAPSRAILPELHSVAPSVFFLMLCYLCFAPSTAFGTPLWQAVRWGSPISPYLASTQEFSTALFNCAIVVQECLRTVKQARSTRETLILNRVLDRDWSSQPQGATKELQSLRRIPNRCAGFGGEGGSIGNPWDLPQIHQEHGKAAQRESFGAGYPADIFADIRADVRDRKELSPPSLEAQGKSLVQTSLTRRRGRPWPEGVSEKCYARKLRADFIPSNRDL